MNVYTRAVQENCPYLTKSSKNQFYKYTRARSGVTESEKRKGEGGECQNWIM